MTRIIFISILILAIVGGGYFIWSKNIINTQKDPYIAKVESRGKLIIGTDPTYPPMEDKDDSGRIIGFDVDLGNEIGKNIGVPVEFKEIPFDDLFSSLKNGQVDLVISSVTITPERGKTLAFSTPYLNAGQSIIVASNNDKILSKDDLKDKRVAAQKDTTSLIEAQKLTAETNLQVYTSEYTKAVSDLVAGKIEAIIMDYPAAIDLTHKNPGTNVVGNPFTSEFYGVVADLENTGLINSVNNTINTLKRSGKLESLETVWFRR